MGKNILNPNGSEIEFGGNKYKIIFNLKTINRIQEEFGMTCGKVVADSMTPGRDAGVLKKLIPIMVNRTGAEEVTEEYVEEMISVRESREISKAIYKEWIDGLPEVEEEDPNSKSGKKKN